MAKNKPNNFNCAVSCTLVIQIYYSYRIYVSIKIFN